MQARQAHFSSKARAHKHNELKPSFTNNRSNQATKHTIYQRNHNDLPLWPASNNLRIQPPPLHSRSIMAPVWLPATAFLRNNPLASKLRQKTPETAQNMPRGGNGNASTERSSDPWRKQTRSGNKGARVVAKQCASRGRCGTGSCCAEVERERSEASRLISVSAGRVHETPQISLARHVTSSARLVWWLWDARCAGEV
jgi:hypothetical protein